MESDICPSLLLDDAGIYSNRDSDYRLTGGRSVKKEWISEGRGYGVPCIYDIKGNEDILCVVVHGLGSSKNGFMAEMMLDKLPLSGIGAIAFDLPAHGESKVEGEFLRIDNCLDDFAAVEARAGVLAPKAEIVYFASSFGAYITLIYLAGREPGKRRAFLRSAAVSMPLFIGRRLTPEQRVCLESAGELVIHKEQYGYFRDLKITKGYCDDLGSHDVFAIWREGLAELRMIHGEADDKIPLADALSFAERFHVPLTVVPGGDHQLSIPGAPELVVKHATEFFRPDIRP